MEIIDLKMKKNKKEFLATTFDGEIISLTPDVILKYSICVGNIDDILLEKAIFESNCSFALNKSMNWLTASYRSESELKKYLRERKYNQDVINYVVEKLKEYNFLSDEYLAKTFVEYGQKKMGIYKMRKKLMEKGISKELIEKSLEDVEPQDDICLRMLQKKMGNNERTREKMAKVYRFLLSKGFDYDTIKRAFNKMDIDEDEL